MYIKPEKLEGVTLENVEPATAEFDHNQFAVIIRDENAATWMQLMAKGYFEYIRNEGSGRIFLQGRLADIYSIQTVEVAE